MNENEILDAEFNSYSNKATFKLISVNKFILLYVLSIGIYGIWWMYKAWKFFKEKDNLDIMPAARSIFALFFIYQLFEKIQTYAKSNGYINSYSSVGLLILYLALNFVSRFPDPAWLAWIFTFICFVQPLQAFNYALQNSNTHAAMESNGFNSKELIIVVVGGIVWVLAIIGLMLPDVNG